ncbi:MAG: GDP-mannose 4,6-dehydratase [Candidatus Cloacimonetes bacterium]|nr:GDP-mannose 4,6-dehydratase [Candidatus Cloacimonadota bacterium]
MTIAVTGSSGFIGSIMVERLKTLNYDIIELDIKNGTDITNMDDLKKIKKFDVLIHLAAKTFVPDSYLNPYSFYHTNVIGTLNVLELCRIYNSKIIFTSSYIYGQPQYLPINEDHPVCVFNPYSQTKILGEQLCSGYNKYFQLPVIIIRPFNIYGKGQNENFIIPKIIKQARTGKVILKDSSPKRDYIHVNDIIDAYIMAIDYQYSNLEIFNIGSGTSISVQELVSLILDEFDNTIEVNFLNIERKNEALDTVADISKAKSLLGWEPKTSLRKGLKDLMRKNIGNGSIISTPVTISQHL